jgi:beta-lactamase class C
MDTTFSPHIRDVIEIAMTRYRLPGIVVTAETRAGATFRHAAGLDAAGQPLTAESLFPVASITKLATALAVLGLVDDGRIALDEPIASVLPDAVAAQDGVTPRRLLAHSSGLPYELDDTAGPLPPGEDWPRLAARCLLTPLERPPGTRVRYSNVGYGLLAIIVERTLGTDFAHALTDRVLQPLGVDGYLGRLPNRSVVRVSDVRGTRVGTEFEPFNTKYWYRAGLPWSGLLTTADGAIRLVNAFDPARTSLIRADTARRAIENQNEDLPGGFVPPLVWKSAWWGLGPDLRDAKSPHWVPPSASPTTYGHTGASGNLVYHDPTRGVTWCILGTRTADNGWLLLAGPSIASAIVDAPVTH